MRREALVSLVAVCIAASFGGRALAQTPGLPFTEDFSTTTLMDGTKTTATWSTTEQKVYLAWRRTYYGAFSASTVGADIDATDADPTYSVALGDMDGDGDLDLVAGNYNQINRLYLNNGTANPFASVTGSDIDAADVHLTTSVALGDVDGDGDLDLMVGNFNHSNRLYLNNGTATPFASVTGSDIDAADAHFTSLIPS
jgi:hypothetical protein